MSYAWTYISGYNTGYIETNNVPIYVPASADNVRPTGWAYVDKTLGDDTTGNGSRDLPYKTILKGNTIVGSSGVVVVAAGTYTETTTPGNGSKIFADGLVVIDIPVFYTGTPGVTLYNLKFVQGYVTAGVAPHCYDCAFINANPFYAPGTSYISSTIIGCTFYNSTIHFSDQATLNAISNNTFHNCNVIFRTAPVFKAVRFNIFYRCNVNFTTAPSYNDYNIFYQCNFRFGSVSASTTYYPSVPAGYVYLNTIADIRAANVSTNGAQTYNFNSCKVADPLFTNSATNDYTLSPNSPAKHKSYYRNYLGAKPVFYPGGFNDASKIINIITRYGLANNYVPVTPPPFIDFHGDSITDEVYLTVNNYPPLVQTINGITCNVYAEGGNTVYDGPNGDAGNFTSGNLQRYKSSTLSKGYSGQYVSFNYGINDWALSIVDATWKSIYKGYIQEYITAGWPANKLILIIPPFKVQYWNSTIQTRNYLHEIADELGILKYDSYQRFKDSAAGNDNLFYNAYHPAQAGQNLIASDFDTFIKR